MLPGFNDSGAHLINLAFFDGNLLTLQIAARESLEMVAKAVRRLTRERPSSSAWMRAGSMSERRRMWCCWTGGACGTTTPTPTAA